MLHLQAVFKHWKNMTVKAHNITLLCLQGQDPNYGNFLTVSRPSISRMLSLPNDSYMLYPVKPAYGSIHERVSKQDSTVPGDKTKPVLTGHGTRAEREYD